MKPLLFYCAFLFLYLRCKEKETHPKKKKLRNFLRPTGVSTKWMYFSIAKQLKISLASQTCTSCFKQCSAYYPPPQPSPKGEGVKQYSEPIGVSNQC